MARRSRRSRSSAIFIRYLDECMEEKTVSVRTSWMLDDKLRELYSAGCEPMSILVNGARIDAYDPNDVDIAVRYLQCRGYEINIIEIGRYQVFDPEGKGFLVTPKALIAEALKKRSEEKEQEAESGKSDSQ